MKCPLCGKNPAKLIPHLARIHGLNVEQAEEAVLLDPDDPDDQVRAGLLEIEAAKAAKVAKARADREARKAMPAGGIVEAHKALDELGAFIQQTRDRSDEVYRSERIWCRLELQRRLEMLSRQAKAAVEEVTLAAMNYWAENWRDDDSPIAERSLGTCKALAA
jgi:hypothetical protein